MNENKLENKKEETIFRIRWYYAFGYLLVFFSFYAVAIKIFLQFWEINQQVDHFLLHKNLLIALVSFAIFMHFLEFRLLQGESKKWEKWAEGKLAEKETETKQTIQNQTAELKKELLETKTELLLTQNKLREKEESLLDSSEKIGKSALGKVRKETKKKKDKTKKRT